MGTSIQVALGLFGILLLFAPACVLIYSAIRTVRVIGRKGAAFIVFGSVLLAISSLDFVFTYIFALLGPTELARYSIVSTYAFKAVNYLAMLSIGIGLLASTQRASTRIDAE